MTHIVMYATVWMLYEHRLPAWASAGFRQMPGLLRDLSDGFVLLAEPRSGSEVEDLSLGLLRGLCGS